LVQCPPKKKKKKTTTPKISWQLMDYIILKNFKKKIIAQNTEISEFVNGASRSKSHFTFKFSFLYNANYKLEALSI
jgi:hypothetical protein